jgi:hypothetical protein
MGRERGDSGMDRTPKSVIAKDVNAVVKPVFLRILIVDTPFFAQRRNGLEDLTNTGSPAATTASAAAATGRCCFGFGQGGSNGWRQAETRDDGCVIGMRRRSKRRNGARCCEQEDGNGMERLHSVERGGGTRVHGSNSSTVVRELR